MAKKDKDIEVAYNKLNAMSYDQKSRMLYEAREKYLHDEATRREEIAMLAKLAEKDFAQGFEEVR